MSDQSTALERPEQQAHPPLPMMSTDEIARSWRVASALARSQMFKDVRQAEQAFARLVMGRDLGMSTTQALSDLHIIEGKPVTGANSLAGFVRALPGADYRVAWLKVVPPEDGQVQTDPPKVEAVWSDEEALDDLRETYGCVVEFTMHGKRRGISRWTRGDSETAGLLEDRGSKKSNHVKYPRAMFFARCMSGGVRLHIPETTRGISVYVEGEIEEVRDELTAGEGDGKPQGVQLAPEVAAVLERARRLRHSGLADRASAEMATLSQPEGVVAGWVARATAVLDDIEPPEAEVVPEGDGSPSEPVGTPAEPEPAEGPVEADSPAVKPEGTESEPQAAQEPVSEQAQAQDPAVLRVRATRALDEALAAEMAGHPDADRLMEEADRLMTEAEAVEDPDQPSFDL